MDLFYDGSWRGVWNVKLFQILDIFAAAMKDKKDIKQCSKGLFTWSRINLPKELGRAPHLDYEHGGSLQRHVELHRNKVREQDLNFGHQSKCHDLPAQHEMLG